MHALSCLCLPVCWSVALVVVMAWQWQFDVCIACFLASYLLYLVASHYQIYKRQQYHMSVLMFAHGTAASSASLKRLDQAHTSLVHATSLLQRLF